MTASERPAVPTLVIHLNARLQPRDRGYLFEDQLDVFVRERLPGVEVTGGGTELGPDGSGPLSCDIELEMRSADGDTLRNDIGSIVEFLIGIGAPRGSKPILDGRQLPPFGLAEGLALYLNGTDLPAEVYRDTDVNELIAILNKAIARRGFLHSWWSGPRETALYFDGRSFEEMITLTSDIRQTHPLCQLSRIERIA